MNLSRLATQWEEAVKRSLADLEKESIRRLNDLVATVEVLIAQEPHEASSIRADQLKLDELKREAG